MYGYRLRVLAVYIRSLRFKGVVYVLLYTQASGTQAKRTGHLPGIEFVFDQSIPAQWTLSKVALSKRIWWLIFLE